MLVQVPKDFVVCPLFAASKQSTTRFVWAGKRHFQIGGTHPLDPSKVSPSLDVRHARALFTLLSFRKPFDTTGKVVFSMSEFCRRYARSYGGRYARELRLLLGDLLDTFLSVQEANGTIVHTYRLIERIEVRQGLHPCQPASTSSELPPTATWIDSITLSPEFCESLDNLQETHPLNLESFTSMTSPLAQAIYLYLPSRAHHHTQDQPFEITLRHLLEQVGHPVPLTRKLRKKLFLQRATSILNQLQDAPTLGGKLKVRIVEDASGEDYKLQAWVDATQTKTMRPPGKMAAAFMASGRTREELERRLRNKPPLEEYEIDLLQRGRIQLEGNERFLTAAKALLGRNQFQMLLAEAKGEILEGRPARKTPTARLIHRVMEALRTPNSLRESPGTIEYRPSEIVGQSSTQHDVSWDNRVLQKRSNRRQSICNQSVVKPSIFSPL